MTNENDVYNMFPVEVSLNVQSGVTESDNDWPSCWTEEQKNDFCRKYEWLTFRNKKLGCKACQFVASLGSETKGRLRVSVEWTNFQITYFGELRQRQLTSLRKKVYEHRESAGHKAALKLYQEARELNDREASSTSGESGLSTSDTNVILESGMPISIAEDTKPLSSEITGTCNTIYLQEPSGSVKLSRNSLEQVSNFSEFLNDSENIEAAFDNSVSTEHLNNRISDACLSRREPTKRKNYPRKKELTENDEEDEFDAFGKYVAMSLRKMPMTNALSVENQIYNAINNERRLILQNKNQSDFGLMTVKMEVEDEPVGS